MVFGDTEAVMPVLAVHGRAIVASLDTHDKLAHACTATIGREPLAHTERRPRGTDGSAVCDFRVRERAAVRESYFLNVFFDPFITIKHPTKPRLEE